MLFIYYNAFIIHCVLPYQTIVASLILSTTFALVASSSRLKIPPQPLLDMRYQTQRVPLLMEGLKALVARLQYLIALLSSRELARKAQIPSLQSK